MFKIRKSLLQSCLFLIGFIFITEGATASFHRDFWPKWEVNNPLSKATIEHDDWQEFLNRRVIINDESINLVDYSHLKPEDRNLLKNYIDKMSKIDIDSYNRNEQLAFWINLYNALTVQVIAGYYPIDSIEEINISPGLFSIGPWGKKLVIIDGSPLSLDDIQNRIIRPVWNDQRSVYALNNGAIGAANLSKKAYKGETIGADLDEVTFNYINSLRGVQVIEGSLIVSKIYDWFNEDFGSTEQDVITHIQQYAKEPLYSQLKYINKIESYVYNWHLNSTLSTNTRVVNTIFKLS
ncbi:MAG: DUF547 domain-containing protein [Tatlockia sp.]|nr:DUF547 domain-containing protein [Tatlockia sp.]